MKQIIYFDSTIEKATWLEKQVVLELTKDTQRYCSNCGLHSKGDEYLGTRCQECGDILEIE